MRRRAISLSTEPTRPNIDLWGKASPISTLRLCNVPCIPALPPYHRADIEVAPLTGEVVQILFGAVLTERPVL